MRAKPRRSGHAGGRASSSFTTSFCARRALLFTAALTSVANASQNHQHPRPFHEAASSSISSSKRKVLLPITPDNFLGAIAECLEEDSNGSCPKYGEESKYGEMKDWNVSEVTDMDYGFHKQESFNGDVSRWDTSSVTSMREMFSGARDFSPDTKKGLGSWDTSSVEDMGSMFSEASNFNGKGLAKWNVGKVKDMSFMLKDAVSFAEDLSAWRPFQCKTTYGMFQNAVEFESDVKDWGLSVTADTKDMFLGAANFLGRFTCEHPLNGPPSTCEDEKKKTALGEKTTVTKMTTLRGSGGKSKKKSFKRVAAMGSDEDDEDADKIEEEVTTVASEDTTHTSSSSILNTNEVDTDAIADSVDGEDEDDETSVPSDVSYPHSEADELTPSSSSWTTTSSTSYVSSSSTDPNIIDCSDGDCPQGTADSMSELGPEDRDAVKDALAIDTESVSLNKESPFVTSEKTLDEFTGKTVKEEEEEDEDDEEDDDDDSDSEVNDDSDDDDGGDDDETVEVSKDQIEDLVEDKEAFDQEFERFMSSSKEEDAASEATAATGDDEEVEETTTSSSKKYSSHHKKEQEEENEESEQVVSASMTNPFKLKADGTVSKKHGKISGSPSSSSSSSRSSLSRSDSLTAKRHHLHVMDQIGDEDVDEELERLKKKLDRLQSETPEEMQAEHNSHGHKQLDDNSFYRAVSKCIIESAAGLCVEYGAVTRFGMMPDWDVSKVSTMTHAFQHYEEFNADLSSWNTKSVTDMSFMFYDAKSFNSDISGWNVAGVTNMKQMFRGAKSLNQDVVSWFANRPSSQMKVLNIDGIFDGAEKIEAAYECGLSKFLDNAMDMCRFSNAARGAKASAKAAAKARAKAGAKSSAKTAAKSGAKATARASETARDASEAELGSSQSFPRLGWNLPREEASSSTDGAGFATLYVCVGMAMVAVAIRAKRDSIVRTMESHFYSSPLEKHVEEKEEEEEENQNIIISNNTNTYGTTLSEEEEETLL